MNENIGEAREIVSELEALQGTPEKKRILAGFFKTGKGQYGEGDVMLGVTVPNTRSVAQKHADLSHNLVRELLRNEVHEVRLCALLILVAQYKKSLRIKDASEAELVQEAIVSLYLENAPRINNWDLVDLSAPYILGQYLKSRPAEKDRAVLYKLAADSLLWRRRIAMVSTLALIRDGQFDDAFRLVYMLMADPEDLMRKAMGWMLREIGKRDEHKLLEFLDENAHLLARTTLRYAIERLSESRREHYMRK